MPQMYCKIIDLVIGDRHDVEQSINEWLMSMRGIRVTNIICPYYIDVTRLIIFYEEE